MSKSWIAVSVNGTVAVFSGNQGGPIDQVIDTALGNLEASTKSGRDIEMLTTAKGDAGQASKVKAFMDENGLGGSYLTDC